MSPFHAAHSLILGMWGGLVAAEAVIEVLGTRRPELREAVTAVHFWLDLLVEIPILAGVVISGALLLLTVNGLTLLLGVKIVAGLAAVASNAICIVRVVRRYRSLPLDEKAYLERTNGVMRTFYLGFPLATAATVIGFLLVAGHAL